MTNLTRLLFIYDADAGPWGALVDSAKKLLRVEGCALCSLTHGLTGERAEWNACRENLGVEVDYLHRDELDAELTRVAGELPCIVGRAADGNARLVMSRAEIERCRGNFSVFRDRLGERLAAEGLVVAENASALGA